VLSENLEQADQAAFQKKGNQGLELQTITIMRKVLFGLFGLVIMLPALAQNKIINDPDAQKRSVSDFHAIKVSTGIVLMLTQGNEEAVAVSAAKPEDRDRIKTTVENGVLKIYYENNSFSFTTNNKMLKAYVSCKLLDGLHVSSGARVEVDGTLKSADLSMDFSSGSDFKGDVSVSSLRIDQGSGSSATISGTAGNLSAEASSGSTLHAFDLQTGQCEVKVSSGAGLDIWVVRDLRASAHRGGRISYKGPAQISSIDTGSGGSVSKE
jgi:hypothetical protein